MIQFCLTITVWILNTVIDIPELVYLWIDVHTSHHTDPFDDTVCVPTVLTSHQFNIV